MSILLRNWADVALGDVVESISSGKSEQTLERRPAAGEPAVIRVSAVSWGRFDPMEAKAVLPSRFRSECAIASGDLLISRANTVELVGAAVLVDADHPNLMLSDKILRLKTSLAIDPKYCLHALRTRAARKHIEANATGTSDSMRNIGQAVIRQIPVSLPPLNEQRRIVAKIEALQARASAAKEALDAIPPLLEKFRQSVLAAAFRGDLTREWREAHPDVEPAAKLLERIRAERKRRWVEANPKKAYVEPEPVDTEGLPELPAGWCWATFQDIASIDSNLVSPGDYLHLPHVAPDNIEKATGRLLEYRTVLEDAVISNNNHFFPGQIVYSKIRPYLSKVIVAEFEGLCSADMYPVTAYVQTAYLFRYMLSEEFLGAIKELAGSRVVLPKANQAQLNAVAVPIAPEREQAEISRLIEASFELQTAISSSVVDQHVAMLKLSQSILSKAFRGELVPQDPNDEPASALLDRIRRERETNAEQAPAKRGRKPASRT